MESAGINLAAVNYVHNWNKVGSWGIIRKRKCHTGFEMRIYRDVGGAGQTDIMKEFENPMELGLECKGQTNSAG
jgi:hypothetical protein